MNNFTNVSVSETRDFRFVGSTPLGLYCSVWVIGPLGYVGVGEPVNLSNKTQSNLPLF